MSEKIFDLTMHCNNWLDEATEYGDRNHLIIKTLLGSGLRTSELISLTKQNINFRGKQILVRGKGKKIRTIDIPPDLSQLLKLYSKELKPKEQLFKLDRSQIYRIVRKITGYGGHMMRHQYAIAVLRKTKNIRYLQRQLGHSSMATTQVYLQFMEFKEEKKKLDNLYGSEQ